MDPEWWRRPSDETLNRIVQRTSLDPEQVRAMTLLGWAESRNDEDADRFTNRRWVALKPTRRRGRHIDICWQCVAEDRRPYLRRLWMLGWAAVCSEHRTVLSGDCPHCRRGILLPPLSATSPIDPLACQRCGEQLAGPNTRAAHPLVIALQDMLIAGKRTGAVVLPGVGETDWATMIAVADMLFGMIWTDVAETHREGLFRRISRDLALDAEDRVALSLANNTGGLLILSWLLEDLQSRLPAAIAILRSVRFDGLLGRLPDVDDDMVARLRTILAPAIATPPTGRGAWRPWCASASKWDPTFAGIKFLNRIVNLGN